MVFSRFGDSLNLYVGTTIGYLVCYFDINFTFSLKNNHVINNNFLEETICDLEVVDLDSDGKQEILVLYFNKKVQIFKEIDARHYELIANFELKEVLNIPFCFATITEKECSQIWFFATNVVYKYSLTNIDASFSNTNSDDIELEVMMV